MTAAITQALGTALDLDGFALIPSFMADTECRQLRALYTAPDARFRNTVNMSKHGFGQGEYKYLARPLPAEVQRARENWYEVLAPIANEWAVRLQTPLRWPERHPDFLAACAAAGQSQPTPLLLRYNTGDYNRLHQDLYGAVYFPLQVVVLLDTPQHDFTGGELILVESRPRMQSRPIIVPLQRGDAAVIPVRERPVKTARGWAKATLRHGVGAVRSGTRHTLGVIFHDAA